MTSRLERYGRFFQEVIRLQSAPLVAVYLILIPTSLLWKKIVPPLDLRKVMVVYNFICSGLSLYSLSYAVRAFVADGVESIFKMEHNDMITHSFFIYWITKNIELLDTVFMVLRHKQRQISFLHVYHHSTILLLSDYAYHFYPWPAIAFMLAMNSLVHVFLYSYYGQSALYQAQRPRWKKLMTQLQIFQFFIGLVHSTYGYLYYGFCVYSIFYGISMMVLFGNFYYQAYMRAKPVHTKQQ